MARRRYQRGSLFLRGNKWIGRWREDVVDDGKSRRVCRKMILGTLKDYPTKRLAQRALDEQLIEINDVNYKAQTRITFEGFAKKWLELVLPQLKPSSRSSAKSHVNKWLIPYFGQWQLSNVSHEAVQKFVNNLSVKSKTTRNILTTLRILFNTAFDWGYVKHKPTSSIRLPAMNEPHRPFFTMEQSKSIIAAAADPYRLMFWLTAETGIRGGELCGLKVSDVKDGVLSIRRSSWRCQLQSPKTKAAHRQIKLSQQLSQRIADYVKNEWPTNEANLLFASRNGKPLDNRNIVRDQLRPILDELKIPRAGLHAFRHGNATALDILQVPLRNRQDRFGHADSFLTVSVYTHALQENDAKIAEALGQLLCPDVSSAVAETVLSTAVTISKDSAIVAASQGA